jgi:hypothetical protein
LLAFTCGGFIFIATTSIIPSILLTTTNVNAITVTHTHIHSVDEIQVAAAIISPSKATKMLTTSKQTSKKVRTDVNSKDKNVVMSDSTNIVEISIIAKVFQIVLEATCLFVGAAFMAYIAMLEASSGGHGGHHNHGSIGNPHIQGTTAHSYEQHTHYHHHHQNMHQHDEH